MSLTTALKKIKKFVHDEDGASGIEYAIIVAMVALVLVGLMPGANTALTATFGKITTALSAL